MANTDQLLSIDSFGEMLKTLRRRAGLTMRALGRETDYSESLISKLEGGRRLPDPVIVKTQFVDALGLREEPELARRLVELALKARDHHEPQAPAVATQESPYTNIQPSLTTFIDRKDEVGQVLSALAGNRLVTLAGAGGVGKTRLALEVGGAALADYAAGVWLVELAPIQAGQDVPQAVAAAFQLREQPDRASLDMLLAYLRDKQLLLVLDNCEHLADACALLVSALLGACRGLRILTTSREPLRMPGEHVLRVPSLTTPDPANLPPWRAWAITAPSRCSSGRPQPSPPISP